MQNWLSLCLTEIEPSFSGKNGYSLLSSQTSCASLALCTEGPKRVHKNLHKETICIFQHLQLCCYTAQWLGPVTHKHSLVSAINSSKQCTGKVFAMLYLVCCCAERTTPTVRGATVQLSSHFLQAKLVSNIQGMGVNNKLVGKYHCTRSTLLMYMTTHIRDTGY